MQEQMTKMLLDYAEKEGTSKQAVLRDCLADLRHIAAQRGLNFEVAAQASYEIFVEEEDQE